MMMRPTSGPPVPGSLRRSMEYVVESLGAVRVEAESMEAVYDRAAATFRCYDVESIGTLSRTEMVAALAEMGAMHGLPPSVIDEVLIQDPNMSRDARYSLHDFLDMYGRLTLNRSKAGREDRIRNQRQNSEPPPGSESNPALRLVFGAYCRHTVGVSRMFISESTPTMVAQQLHKLCMDINTMEQAGEHSRITTSSVDIAYTRCKTPGGRRLSFHQFLRVLCILGDESGLDLFRIIKDHASRLGTHGLPAPVDPVTMRPLKGVNTEMLPFISRDSKNQQMRASSSHLPQRPHTAAAAAAPRHRTASPSTFRVITPPAGHTFVGERPTSVPVARALLTNNFVLLEEGEVEGKVQGKDAVTLAYEAAMESAIQAAAMESAVQAAASAVVETESLRTLGAVKGQKEDFSDYSGRHWQSMDRNWSGSEKKWEGVPLNYIIPSNPDTPLPVLSLEEVQQRILILELFTGVMEDEDTRGQGQGGSPLQQLRPKVRLFERLKANEAAIEEIKFNAFEVPPKDTALGSFLAILDDGVAGAHEAVQAEAAQVHEGMKGLQEQLDKADAALREAEERRLREVLAMREAEDRRWREAEKATSPAISAITSEAAARHEALLKRLAALESTVKKSAGIDEAMLEERLRAMTSSAGVMTNEYAAEREFMKDRLESALQQAEQAASGHAALQLRLKALEEQAASAAGDAASATEAMVEENTALRQRLSALEEQLALKSGLIEEDVSKAVPLGAVDTAAFTEVQARLSEVEGHTKVHKEALDNLQQTLAAAVASVSDSAQVAAETCAAALARVEASELLIAELSGKLHAEQKQGLEMAVSVQELRGQVDQLQFKTLSEMSRVRGSEDGGTGMSMMEHKLEGLRDQLRREIQTVQLRTVPEPEEVKDIGVGIKVLDSLSNRVSELESQVANQSTVKLLEPLALLEQQLRAQEAGIIAASGAAAAAGKSAGQASEQAASVVAIAGAAGEAATASLTRVEAVELMLSELNEKLLQEQRQGIETASSLQELSGQLARLQGQVVTTRGGSTTSTGLVPGSAKSGPEVVILGENTVASQGSQQLAASASDMQAQPSIPMFSRGSRPVTPSGYINMEMFTGVTERLAELEGRVDYTAKRLGVIGPMETQVRSHETKLADTAEIAAAATEAVTRMTETVDSAAGKLEAMEQLVNELSSELQEVRASAATNKNATPEDAASPQESAPVSGATEAGLEPALLSEEHGPLLQALASRLAAVETQAVGTSGSLNNLAQSFVELRIMADRAEARTDSIDKSAEEATSRITEMANELAVVKAVKQFSAISPKPGSEGGVDQRKGKELVASVAEALESQIQHLAMAVGELAGRTVAMERDLTLTLTSYARVVDLKESENHLLDRQQQLHDEVEMVKGNMRTLREDMIQYSSSLAATISLQQQTSTLASPLGTQPSKRVSVTVAGKVMKPIPPAPSAEMSTVTTKTFATWDVVKQNEVLMMQKITALKTDFESLSQTAMDRVEAHEQIIMRLAHQIDVLQSEVCQEQAAAAGLGIADVEALLDQKAFVTLNDVDGLNQLVANMQMSMDERQNGICALRSDLMTLSEQDKADKQNLRDALQLLDIKASGSQGGKQMTESFEAKLTELVDVRMSTSHAGVKELIGSIQTEVTASMRTQIKSSQDSVLETLSNWDAKLTKRVDLQEKVIMRIAQQVDVLQKAAPAAVKAAAKAAVTEKM
ncbi:hypothetical protein CEUSTIGMA_g3577.t1 [Chlamydomonas eustigma]|uniref:EF-hand domain-containing protein n=1 Tax=Chlamydomonas eustigma TaxID=1157962 RepID=A0A250WZ61_9CHLO|nr:hypothetical protein CEUSTIGMA_g3577.t1 [Chlamydomonas eustigma]|eukprot:GAX76134.1 hypothetical protein CEUSTIGMA_g3577.t1 [Chlamydomonas eustigma]